MAAMVDDNIVRFTYTGQEVIPRGATHVFVYVRNVPRSAFDEHPSIVEVICHEGVEKIGECAFRHCHFLRRVIMPGVKIFEEGALCGCEALEVVECGKLEIIKESAFHGCESLRSINLPSARIVEMFAFGYCCEMTEVNFGNKLERFSSERGRMGFRGGTFCDSRSLERITIPLKDGLITADDTFYVCGNLKHVDLVEGEIHQCVAALQLEDWKNDIAEEIDSINRILLSARPGYYDNFGVEDHGEKAQAIRRWIRSVLGKIDHYKAEHDRLLNEAADTLQLVMPCDVAMNGVLSFLALPS